MALPATAPSGWVKKCGPALIASVFLLIFYWRGLNTWFYQDDFGWLHLGPAKGFVDFLAILFAPKAHGNIRPWSENLFFYGLHSLFGVNPLPFRIVVFATAIADTFLLAALTRRLTGSGLASGAAPILWLANACVAPALCWTSIYNETQYLVFVLLALLLFLEGRYGWQIVVFALGLGSLETAVMYPAIALLYAWLYDRAKLRRTVPLFAISAAYTLLHFLVAPTAKAGPYAIQIDSRIVHTLGTYVQMVLGPERLTHFHWLWPAWVTPAGTLLMAAAATVAIIAGGRAGIFGLGWFVLLLVPVIALPEHIEDYVLTGPAMGLAILLAGAIAARPRIGAVIAALYLAVSLPAAWDVEAWHYTRSRTSGDLVTSIVAYNREHPGKTLLITGMNTDQFDAGFADVPFELYGMHNVYLAPGAERNIHDGRGIANLYVVPAGKAAGAVVLDVSSGRAR
ncbi:MAG TPA: hypothetical protein VMH80_20835 [Bryobacteraceae bacterium]|nr:hypothetical protein [Bryobacteraceae bacterium]